MMHESLEKRLNSELRSSNLTLAQLQLLLTLYDSKDKTFTLKELEKRLHVAQSTIVGTTSRLEKKGFIMSLSVPDDKRIKKVGLTTKGEECCLTTQNKMEDIEKLLLSNLNDEEKEQFICLLKKVYEVIK
ncbi:MarR family transcriptional regulator [Clostridioides difficile]|nr:MarR family transcriptional regulator [Clostridioides difficile]